MAIVLVILSFLTWLYVLRYIPLSVAFPISQVVHALVPLCSWIFLGELISTLRWCGIALVLWSGRSRKTGRADGGTTLTLVVAHFDPGGAHYFRRWSASLEKGDGPDQ